MLQIATSKMVLLFDMPALASSSNDSLVLEIVDILKNLFSNPNIVKIGTTATQRLIT